MKITPFRYFQGLLAICSLSLALVSCDKDINDNTGGDPTYNTTGNADGSQQTPPVTTSATATLFGEFNARTNNWEYRINWSGLSSTATAVQIHGPATIGTAGQMQIALTISVPGATGKAEGNVTLSAEQETYLLANQLYYTILSATHVNGEIRGQIIAQRVQ